MMISLNTLWKIEFIDVNIIKNKLYIVRKSEINMVWRTYLVKYFGTGNVKVSEIAKRVEKIGFKTVFGSVDFIYEWEEMPTKEQVLALGDRLCDAVKGSGAVFNLDTHD